MKCGARYPLYFLSIMQIFCQLSEILSSWVIQFTIECENTNKSLISIRLCFYDNLHISWWSFCICNGICRYPATTKTLFTSEKRSVILRRGLNWFFSASCCFGCCSFAFSDKNKKSKKQIKSLYKKHIKGPCTKPGILMKSIIVLSIDVDTHIDVMENFDVK